MIELAAELDRVSAVGPSQVALILSIVNLAILRQVGGKSKAEVGVGGVRESDVWWARRDVGDSALWKAGAASELEKALAIADTNLLNEIVRPRAGIVPPILAVLSRNSHIRSAGDDT